MKDTKIELKDNMIEMKEIKAQLEVAKFEDVKKQFEDVMKQLEDTKLQLDDKEIQLEDTKTLLENSKAEISEFEKKLAEMYSKDPCKNCKGPTVCLDGQFIRNTPEHGTMIRAVKDTSYIYKNAEVNYQVKAGADDFGTVDTVQWGRPVVKWNTRGNYYCADFTKYVYKCK